MLLGNAKIVAIDKAPGKDQLSYCMIDKGAVAIEGEKIVWVGDADAIPEDYKDSKKFPYRDLEGRLITPALIDCHTHVVHGGNRAVEFEMRLQGESYEEIPCGRWYCLNRKRNPRRQCRRIAGKCLAAGRWAASRGCLRDRGQIRLRAGPRHGTEHVARRTCD